MMVEITAMWFGHNRIQYAFNDFQALMNYNGQG